jgi:hypothetical protein
MDTKVSAPQTRRFLRKREAILDAAARQFNRDGVRGRHAGRRCAIGRADHQQHHLLLSPQGRPGQRLLSCARSAWSRNSHAKPPGTNRLAARITHFVSGWYEIQRDIARQARPELVSFNEVRTLPPSHSGAVFDAYNDMFRAVRALLGKASAGAFRGCS